MEKTITIVIPCYEMNGKGAEYLGRLLDSLEKQSYKNFAVIVVDNSKDESLKDVCQKYFLDYMYIKNPNGNCTKNLNVGIKHATGSLIRFMAQDDHLAHKDALKDTLEAFKGKWLVVGCSNNPKSYWTGDIHQGNNKLGGPSCLTIKNDNSLFFNEELTWMFDCDYYKRMFDLYGEPTILDGVNVEIGIGEHQLTDTLSSSLKRDEVLKLREIYD